MSKWIRRGDLVKVLAGNDKGKTGEVLSRMGKKVIVRGVNIRKKHLRPTQQAQGGRIVEMEKPINISNVSVCDKDGNSVVLRVQIQENARELVYRRGDKVIVHRTLRKS